MITYVYNVVMPSARKWWDSDWQDNIRLSYQMSWLYCKVSGRLLVQSINHLPNFLVACYYSIINPNDDVYNVQKGNKMQYSTAHDRAFIHKIKKCCSKHPRLWILSHFWNRCTVGTKTLHSFRAFISWWGDRQQNQTFDNQQKWDIIMVYWQYENKLWMKAKWEITYIIKSSTSLLPTSCRFFSMMARSASARVPNVTMTSPLGRPSGWYCTCILSGVT